jgi:hypothetical protein
MGKLIWVVIVWSAVLGSAQDWQQGDLATRRLAPSEFPALPSAIRRDLERRGCTIPQSFAATSAENVVRGRFTSAAGPDWAVLCSVGRVSSILVFNEGSTEAVAELAQRPDSASLQVVDADGTIGYSRAVRSAGPSIIRSHNAGAALPRLDHEGIDDVFLEKGSMVWYWSDGRWIQLLGSD